jgi:hypothetical protein
MKKNIINTFFLLSAIVFVTSFSSCLDNILGFECGEDIFLGALRFSDTTKNLYSNWTGSEVLVFKDSLGKEVELSSKGKEIKFNWHLVMATLCNKSILDNQKKYYSIEHHELKFQNRTNDNPIYLWVILGITKADEAGRAYVYDEFEGDFSHGSSSASLYIASKREDPISFAGQTGYSFTTNNFVADTTISGKIFKNVYYFNNSYTNSAIYFQKKNMIIAYRDSGRTWLLDRIK